MPETYRSPHAGTIADLIGRRGLTSAKALDASGDAQARAALVSGQAWGNAIQNIGQGVSGTLADFAQQRQEAPIRAQQAQTAAMQAEVLSRQLSAMKTEDAHAKIGELAGVVKASGYDPATAEPIFRAIGALSPDYADPLMRSLMDPAQLKGVTDYLLTQSPGYKAPQNEKLGPDDVLIDPAGKEIARGLGKPAPAPSNPTEASLAMAAANGDQAAVAALEFMRAQRPEARAPQPTEASLAMAAANGDKTAAAALDRMKAQRASSAGSVDDGDAEEIANAIISGDQPPTLQGLYRNGGPVRAALAKAGYPLATAMTDWAATQKHFSTLNGAQQTRLRQAADTAMHSLDVIEDLANQWQGGKFPILNKAQLKLAKNGALGPEAQSIATQLEAQISDVTSELANVYMGGNSPTDHALTLAAKNLSADWTQKQLTDALKLSRTNLGIRLNSIKNTGVIGASPNNPYVPQQTPTPPAPSQTVKPSGRVYYDMNGNPIKKP